MQQGPGTTQLGGYAAAAGTALTWVAAAYTAYQAGLILARIIWECDADELELAVKRELRLCRAVGSFCSTGTPAGCLVARRSYCCFASPFSRIVNEQVRTQVTGAGFGAADGPDCSGIGLEAMRHVDWSKVDLSEWTALLADNGLLPDAESLTLERLTGNLRKIAGAPSTPIPAEPPP